MKQMVISVGLALVMSIFLMRAPVTCVGPVAEALRDALGASYLTYGLVSSLPVLMFGVVGFFAPVLFSRFSTKVGLFLVLSVLSFGLALRLIVALPALVLGTLLVGAGIAVLNTVIPVVLRHFFPGSVATALGIYTAATGCSSFAGSLLAIPLLNATGTYAVSLGVWVVLALPAAFFWFISPDKSLPDLRAPERKPISGQAFSLILTKLPVIGTMCLQSLVVYAMIAWLPPLLMSQGMKPGSAGLALSVLLIGATVSSLLITPMIRLFGSEKRLSLVLTFLSIAPFALLFFSGIWPFFACALLSVPHGARFSLALILISKSASSLPEMLFLSSLSQGLGYSLAALGPIFCAGLYGGDGNWAGVLIFLAAASILWGIMAVLGFAQAKKA